MATKPKLIVVHDEDVLSRMDEARDAIRTYGAYKVPSSCGDVSVVLDRSMRYVLTVKDPKRRILIRIERLSEKRALLDLMSFQEESRVG